MSFESKAAAKKRKEPLEISDVPSKKIKKKDHTGDLESMTWDKQALKHEVEGYADDHEFSWSELARRFNVYNKSGQPAKNGGQIVKKWLLSQSVNLTRFTRKQKPLAKIKTRRKKRKGHGGEISIPTEAHPSVLKQQLAEKIQSGEYSIGEMIVPKKVTLYNC